MHVTKVFLSYASQDGGVARTLAALLRRHGFEVFWYEETNLGDFVSALADGLAKADRFIVLLSRHYQRSDWCMAEWNTAFRLSTKSPTNRPVITVCEIGDFEEPVQAFLDNYARLDLRAPVEAKLPALLSSFGVGPIPVDGGRFRNREEEITELLDALGLTSGQDLWVVTAPPRMGKSWFLREAEKRLVTKGWGETRLLDLARHPGLWSAPAAVVVELLAVDLEPDGDFLSAHDIETVVHELGERNNHQLYLLDSVDRLDRKTAAEVRRLLTEVYARILERRAPKRFSMIIGTRRPDVWRGLGRGTQSRFRTLHLSEFKLYVIEAAVREGLSRADENHVRETAALLQRESDGLPALLVAQLGWAHHAAKPEAFETVTARYVRRDLLTHNVLFPSGVRNAPAAKKAVNHALKVLSPYRLITLSHLKFHFDDDAALQEKVTAVGWNMRDLWTALNSTSLLDPRMGLWRVINPPIRRVLYRYYCRTDAERIAAQEEAKRCYQRWTVNEAGSEQVVMMAECLWHEACRQLLQQPARCHETLPAAAAEFARAFLNSERYDPREFVECAHDLLTEDHEFQLALENHAGLFQDVLTAIDLAVSEGT